MEYATSHLCIRRKYKWRVACYTVFHEKSLNNYFLSHTVKNTANQKPGEPLNTLRYSMGSIQRVVFHSAFPSCLAHKWYVCAFLRTSRFQLNVIYHLRTFPNNSDHIRKFSDDFRTLPKISEDFPKIFKSHKNASQTDWNSFRRFPKIFRTFPNTSEDFRRLSEAAGMG